MKKKITISLEEDILNRIDKTVEKGDGKNRSNIIEGILKERYGDFVDVTAIIFSHDKKWDNRQFPFSMPKSLLEVRNKTIISRQVEVFTKFGIKNIIIIIPIDTTEQFKDELLNKFPFVSFEFLEQNYDLKTGTVLKEALKLDNTGKNLLISNGDIFYGSINIEEYYNYHKEQKSDFSLCLKFVLNPEQLGNVQINGNKIVNFVEKPKSSQMNLTNSGLYITNRDFLDKHDFGEYLERDYFPLLPDLGNTIGYVYSGEWEHIQNDSAYERINGWLM